MEASEMRFWSKVIKTEACWVWQGKPDTGGYGSFVYEGKNMRAHRLACHLSGIKLDPSLVIDHLCRNKLCVNPEHLEQVPQSINVARAPHPGPLGQRWSKNGLGPHGLADCGSAASYKRGCRCDDCRGYQNDRMAEYRRRKTAA